MTLFLLFDQLMAEIMGANHYCSHMMMQADLDMESTKFEIQSLRRVIKIWKVRWMIQSLLGMLLCFLGMTLWKGEMRPLLEHIN